MPPVLIQQLGTQHIILTAPHLACGGVIGFLLQHLGRAGAACTAQQMQALAHLLPRTAS
jgi:hypothetical protein